MDLGGTGYCYPATARLTRARRGSPVPMYPPEDRELAVVTGASSGIGLELAKQFAQGGFDLIVAAEDDELAAAAREVQELGVAVDPVQVDLATGAGGEQLHERIAADGRPLAAIALNAGIGAG